ncbi:MAG: hypothetical protein RIS35_2882 [Pseudomonadota bacterium]|jgi:chromate transporter
MNAPRPPDPTAGSRPISTGPRDAFHLFLVFTGLAVRGFGGVLPWAQRVLVDETRWMTVEEYLETLSLAQALPGPNICNLALMVGERFLGLRGALAALAGMLLLPLAIVMTLALLYAGVASSPVASNALAGMGAVSAGLIVAMALRLLQTQRGNRTGWLFAAAAFAMVGVLRWPLAWVMPVLGVVSVLIVRRRLPK